ncbi:hypothetical protein RH08_00015 [Candidatus Liberibacter asiaticus]|uniref:Bordetella phage Bbp38 like protein n=2 Tax=Liberibacter asiaticus TaxID=34021 RepID=G3XG04_LIBAS|nr:DUF2800 domain-containing protein [Candidatus Liberibacter asiaticus]AGH17468.1 hypothetical protein WSI_05555 [Candidatus Liberibacter asiaticus str. gxpsy]AGH17508.1 hypothetical protein WSI_05755 [Candidatus Liberibacter asiaticus str. gxpsy]KAE9515978.1 PD-(D/E)XK nuclease superfamily protein [Candidatus Liberibacter asiaticus]KIH95364.1 hypothetical protein RH08_00015 [Candidatus Liberibacter asiaticus]BAL04207.1 bordetella phage Bbp38 like protein [Candidatus Liberibacter asiaticus]
MAHHAFLSASSSHRWLKCPIAPTLESKIPQTTSIYASEGTFAHNLLAHCLEQGVDAETVSHQKLTFENDTRIVDTEMASSVSMVLAYVRTFSGPFLSETEVPLEPFTTEPGATGTADILIFNNAQWIIVDFKYGAGVPVKAENNTQLMLYACGALHQYGDIFGRPEALTLTIIQPRVRTGSPINEWVISADDLLEKAKEFKERGTLALSLKSKRAVSLEHYGVNDDSCRFCRAKVRCPALSRHVLLEATKDPSTNTTVELSKAYSSISLIKSYVKACEDEMFKRLNAGDEIQGYQLVEGRKGNRSFKDINRAQELLTSVLGEEAFKRILKTPKELEQLYKEQKVSDEFWEELQELITRGDGKPVIAPRDIPTNKQTQKSQLSEFEVIT